MYIYDVRDNVQVLCMSINHSVNIHHEMTDHCQGGFIRIIAPIWIIVLESVIAKEILAIADKCQLQDGSYQSDGLQSKDKFQ